MTKTESRQNLLISDRLSINLSELGAVECWKEQENLSWTWAVTTTTTKNRKAEIDGVVKILSLPHRVAYMEDVV